MLAQIAQVEGIELSAAKRAVEVVTDFYPRYTEAEILEYLYKYLLAGDTLRALVIQFREAQERPPAGGPGRREG